MAGFMPGLIPYSNATCSHVIALVGFIPRIALIRF